MTDLSLIISQIRQRLEILYQEVDRLEEGGGGGGGTDNYNNLSNKPQINSVTLSGNKSLADLGIAPASTTYTKTQVDSALSGKADKSDTYTKTETAAEIQGAITELDVSSTTATGHYIKSIAQENGLIVPVADTVQDYASPSSTHPITSGAVASIQSTLNTAITKNANGITALINDGPKNLVDPMVAVGYNYQTAYPYESSGLIFTLNADSSITVTGSNTGSAAKTFRIPIRVKVGQSYTLSGCPANGSSARYQLDVRETGTNTIIATDTGSSGTFTAEASTYDVCIRIATGYNLGTTGQTFYIMVCDSDFYNYSNTFATYIPTLLDLDAAIDSLDETKAAMSNVYGLGTNIYAAENNRKDLNNYTTPGRYYAGVSVVGYIDNKPLTGNAAGFQLTVEYNVATNRYIQTITYNTTEAGVLGTIYKRWFIQNNVWSSWYKYEGTVVS